jgi:hypothetical protein
VTIRRSPATSSGCGLFLMSRADWKDCCAAHSSRSAGNPRSASVHGMPMWANREATASIAALASASSSASGVPAPNRRAIAASCGRQAGRLYSHDVGHQCCDPQAMRRVSRADRILDRVGRGSAGHAEGEPCLQRTEHHLRAGGEVRPVLHGSGKVAGQGRDCGSGMRISPPVGERRAPRLVRHQNRQLGTVASLGLGSPEGCILAPVL